MYYTSISRKLRLVRSQNGGIPVYHLKPEYQYHQVHRNPLPLTTDDQGKQA
ncbi:uncharacterized protein G2W53_020561 [Senna tora]|uniref:Uncharacterized protein n=1 Tax=Senna tora TaxID=362788 RepID=A0A834TWL8_9FABA|nr:uncharacterized protein G2W53_020561 [Senna tora]